jgi:hypothetical protein
VAKGPLAQHTLVLSVTLSEFARAMGASRKAEKEHRTAMFIANVFTGLFTFTCPMES